MLNGRYCAEPFEVTNRTLEQAIANLERFDFVGITSQWNASVCLFHAELKLREPDWSLEGINVRPGNYNHTPSHELSDLQKLVSYNERFDIGLFNEGMALFRGRLREHPQCEALLV